MKSTLLYITLLFLLLILPKCQHSKSVNNNKITSGFTGDSGYIYDSELLNKIKFDTVDSLYQRISIHKNDTIGKYYKGSNGHYFSCLDAYIGVPGFILVETLRDGTIIAKEQFGIGIHACCWDGRYEGFKKYGDYVSFRSCTTGTGICGGSVQLFKALRPQDKIGSISESMGSADGFGRDHTSTMEIKNDTAIMHYTVVDYSEEHNKKVVTKTKKLSIRYVDNNAAWTPLDSIKLY